MGKDKYRKKVLEAFQEEIPCKIVDKYSVNIEEWNDKQLKKILKKYIKNYKQKKIIFVSVYHKNYTRTETLIEIFKRNGIKFETYFFSGFLKYIKILWFVLKTSKKDNILFLSFRGHEILPFIRLFWGKNDLIFDIFISLFDTLCNDRKKIKSDGVFGKLLKGYDKWLCNLSTIALVDTKSHRKYFMETFNVNNIESLYVDCNRKLFCPIENKKNKTIFKVFWYGGAQPVHGVDTIIKVAKKLENTNKDILFILVGPLSKKLKDQISSSKNIQHYSWLNYDELPKKINESDLCLGGHFGKNIDKAQNTIAGKTFQFISCKVPTLVSKSPANSEIFNFN